MLKILKKQQQYASDLDTQTAKIHCCRNCLPEQHTLVHTTRILLCRYICITTIDVPAWCGKPAALAVSSSPWRRTFPPARAWRWLPSSAASSRGTVRRTPSSPAHSTPTSALASASASASKQQQPVNIDINISQSITSSPVQHKLSANQHQHHQLVSQSPSMIDQEFERIPETKNGVRQTVVSSLDDLPLCALASRVNVKVIYGASETLFLAYSVKMVFQ